jgi:hypothetical protein
MTASANHLSRGELQSSAQNGQAKGSVTHHLYKRERYLDTVAFRQSICPCHPSAGTITSHHLKRVRRLHSKLLQINLKWMLRREHFVLSAIAFDDLPEVSVVMIHLNGNRVSDLHGRYYKTRPNQSL